MVVLCARGAAKASVINMLDKKPYIAGMDHMIHIIQKYMKCRRSNIKRSAYLNKDYVAFDQAFSEVESWMKDIKNNFVNFKNFVELNESPLKYKFTQDFIDDINKYYMEKLGNDYKLIDNIIINTKFISVFQKIEGLLYSWYFIDKKGNKIGFYQFINEKDQIIEKLIWQSKNYKGWMFKIYVEYILNRFNMIISDEMVSQFGDAFLLKIYEYGLSKKYEVGVIHVKTNQIIDRFKDLKDLQNKWEVYSASRQDKINQDLRFYIKR